MAQPMEIIGRNMLKFFISAVLLCTITTKIATMDAPDGALSPFMPLQTLCNECINDATIEGAFNETFNLICTQVVIRHRNLGVIKHWLQSKAQKESSSFVARIQEKIGHQMLWHTNEQIQQDFLNYTIYLFQKLGKSVSQFNEKNRALVQFIDEAISTGQTPSYLDDAKLLQEAIELEISCWTRIKKNCTLV